MTADLILRGGRIWTGHGAPLCQAIAMRGDRVLATGSDARIAGLASDATRVVDLAGRFAMPGLIDSHLHLIATGLMRGWVDAGPLAAPSRVTLMRLLAERAAITPAGAWVQARGFDQTRYADGRMPSVEELDAAVPDHPARVSRACGHVMVVNSRALALAGIDRDTPDPEGGLIGREDGRLTGMLAENAQNLIFAAQPGPTQAQLVEAIGAGGRYLLGFGITSCMDAAVGQIAGMDEIRAYRTALSTHRLPVRVWATLLGDPTLSIVDACHAEGLVTGAGGPMFRIGGVKIFTDGSAGGRTAWMREPYLGQPDTRGVRMLDDDRLFALVRRYHGLGYTLVCHAIGDAAIDQLLRAYADLRRDDPGHSRRHRIEHCGFADDAQSARMKADGILPAPQQVFVHSFGDSYIEVLGEARGRRAFPIGTWQRMGLRPSTGSDSPVCSPDPFPNIHAMLTRQTHRGTVLDATEVLSPEDALRAYTEDGAWSQGLEAEKGRLDPGMLADVAVFSRDLLSAPPADILRDTRCEMTVLGGRVVHDRLQ